VTFAYLIPVRGILRTGLIEAAGQRFSSLPPEAVTPLGTEDRTLCLTARISWCISERALGVVTGEVRAGKTVAIRAALAGLAPSRHTVCVPTVPKRPRNCRTLLARHAAAPGYAAPPLGSPPWVQPGLQAPAGQSQVGRSPPSRTAPDTRPFG
jgi:hypothetical protein